MATSLDYRPPKLEDQYDPRMLQLMRLYGINPGVTFPPGSRKAQQQAKSMEDIQTILARQDTAEAGRQERRDAREENQALRADYQKGASEERLARTDVAKTAAATQRAQQLQFLAGDPSQPAPIRDSARNAMVTELGLPIPTGAAAAGGKGEYGPGGAPAAPAPPGALAPTAAPGYQPPAGTFGGEIQGPPLPDRTAETYGVDVVQPGMIPAANIPDFYGGKSEIPAGGQPGYYKGAEFAGPAYGGAGEKLPRPAGATGFVGTPAGGATVAPTTGAPGTPGTIPYTPPTGAFTQGTTAPSKIQVGFEGQPQLDIASIGLNPNVPSNQRLDLMQEQEMRKRGVLPPKFRY